MTKQTKKPHETIIDRSNSDPVPQTPVEQHRDDRDIGAGAASDSGAAALDLMLSGGAAVAGSAAADGDQVFSTLATFGPTVRVKKVHPHARIPQYQSAGAACFDLHTIDSGYVPPGGAVSFNTGLAFEVPEGYAMKIYSRSGHGVNHRVRLANGTGMIDSDYRGEIVVTLANDHRNSAFEVAAGARIAQALLVPVYQWKIEEAEELSATARGSNGHGSTGD